MMESGVKDYTWPICKDCVHRILINVYKTFSGEQKHEQYYACVLSYCNYRPYRKSVLT